MTYAELIEILKPYAEEEVWLTGTNHDKGVDVVFFAGNSQVVALSREWGTDKVEQL